MNSADNGYGSGKGRVNPSKVKPVTRKIPRPGGPLPDTPPSKVYAAGKIARAEYRRVLREWGEALGRADLSLIEDYCLAVRDMASLDAAVRSEESVEWGHLTVAQRISLLDKQRQRCDRIRIDCSRRVQHLTYAPGATAHAGAAVPAKGVDDKPFLKGRVQ